MDNKFIRFDNGFDFYRDLLATYGKEEAVKIANTYLDCQAETKDFSIEKEEYQFCCELYHAMQIL